MLCRFAFVRDLAIGPSLFASPSLASEGLFLWSVRWHNVRVAAVTTGRSPRWTKTTRKRAGSSRDSSSNWAKRLIRFDLEEALEQIAAIPLRWDDETDTLRPLRIAAKQQESEDVTSFVLEPVDGMPLDQQLPRTYSEAVRIFKQTAEALSHMHSRGFVHADIKPSNILLSEDEQVKIIDLGQACHVSA